MSIPTILYVAMMDIVTPAEYFFEEPASKKVMGTMAAVPSPTRQNPIMEGQKYGKTTATAIPAIIKVALIIYVLGIPN